ncbi:MAG: sigma-70 family RNA polymerase sigma factor [Lachnospiraceae bacterium]|nr:sigma-70 family RNA polymerase sigma factor [Lachnospiraceae bacterium]
MTNDQFIMLLSDKYYKPLYQYAIHICDDSAFAADIVQETLMTAYQKADELQKHENISGWLYQTARYKMLQMLANIRRYKALDNVADTLADNRDYEEECITRLELYPEMARNLSLEDLNLILKHYEEGFGYNELAEEYCSSEITIRSRVRRIRNRLRKTLDGKFA